MLVRMLLVMHRLLQSPGTLTAGAAPADCSWRKWAKLLLLRRGSGQLSCCVWPGASIAGSPPVIDMETEFLNLGLDIIGA